MASIFTKIIEGDIPCYKIYEDEHYFSFLDIRPMAKGHTLLVPKKEIDYIFDIDDELLTGYLPVAKKIAKALEKVVPCRRVGIAVIGLEVPHAHVHLIPLNQIGDLRFDKPVVEVSPEEMNAIASEVRHLLEVQ
jgi:histidine triad (HIT) family protein